MNKKSLFGVITLVQLLLFAVLTSQTSAYQQFDLSKVAYYDRVKTVLGLKPEHEAMLAQYGWPSYNLLQFRLSESNFRARSVSLFSIIIPSVASIAGPAAGGLIIENFGFTAVLGLAVALYFVALTFFMQVDFKRETSGLTIPRGKKLLIFFATFIIFGLCEAYWLAYPLFVNSVSEIISRMGFVLALTSLVVSVITFLVNWLSDIKMRRPEFATWFFLLGHATAPHQIVFLSTLSGLASAFTISWFAHYGDSFSREQYASILVLMEVGLMIGRLINLAPTYIFISKADYQEYFTLLGALILLVIPFLAYSRHFRTQNTQEKVILAKIRF
ncbi:MAG: hypothetical protein QXL54_04105 [Candidatus Bathyarchaeia archaeon]